MKRLLTLGALLFLSVGASLVYAPTLSPVVSAAPSGGDIFNQACEGLNSTSPTCNSAISNKKDNPLTGSNGLLMKIARIIAIIAGITAVIMIIVGGMNYITASGDAQKAKKARDMIIGALIGLVIISLSSVIITFVINNSGV